MANIQDIKDRISKYEVDIEKRKERIQKLEQKELKLKGKLLSMGFEIPEYDKFSCLGKNGKGTLREPNSFGHRYYDRFAVDTVVRILKDGVEALRIEGLPTETRILCYDFIHSIQDQLDCWNKIFDIEDKITNAKTKLQQEQARQSDVEDVPPILKELMNEMETELTKEYLEIWNAAQETKKRMRENPTFRKEIKQEFDYMYGSNAFELNMRWTEQDVIRNAKRDAEFYVLDLIRRVTKKVGEIVDYKDLEVRGPAINGVIVGTNGSTRLETITAGGYNIQRRHYRVILH